MLARVSPTIFSNPAMGWAVWMTSREDRGHGFTTERVSKAGHFSVTDMSKSRQLGLLEYQATDDSFFFDLSSRLRDGHLIT
jgi:hypothetical protein